MKSFIVEFKEFALNGNVFDMAIGIIIGSAIAGVVNSLVADILMPLLSGLFSADALGKQHLVLNNGSLLNYGTFLTKVISFLLIAFCIFLMVKSINRVKERYQKPKVEAAKVKSEELVTLEAIKALLESNLKSRD